MYMNFTFYHFDNFLFIYASYKNKNITLYENIYSVHESIFKIIF